MNGLKQYYAFFIPCLFITLFLPLVVVAQEIPSLTTYMPDRTEAEKHKKFFDDPRPYIKTWNDKTICPPEVYNLIASDDPEEMKKKWAEVVGFKAPDMVGKIHPEIKPGKYTYKEVQSNPAFKELMYPELYNRIKPGGPPFAGSIPEFEIIPTRQYYWHLRISEATQKNQGKTKLDAQGYVDHTTWEGGFPFPRPSGSQKAQQIAYNSLVFRQDLNGGNGILFGHIFGFDKNLKIDMDNKFFAWSSQLSGRVFLPPYGYLDKQAEKKNELSLISTSMLTPRDIAGMVITSSLYLDAQKTNAALMYVPAMRRVRKMSATDTQDPIAGQDLIVDDSQGFSQKLSPTRYPYKYEIVDEREYLVAAPTIDGAEYVTSKGKEIRNLKMERRPIYVLEMTQTDPNYVYSKRVIYIDKETFEFYQINNYDSKGRLYREFWAPYQYKPESGMFTWGGYVLYADHVDLHSGLTLGMDTLGKLDRRDIMRELMRSRK
jgi:hypothetical protein